MAMQGRFHYYEGYSMKQITLPVRVMNKLGVNTLLISNACGGMNPMFRRGDLMIISDHINLLGDNPLIGPNLDEFGPRFPDMSEPYSQELIELAENIALENKVKLQKGVFVAVSGPNLERSSRSITLSGILIATFLSPAVIKSDIIGFFLTINVNLPGKNFSISIFAEWLI